MKHLPVPDAVAEQVHRKRDEYRRMAAIGRCPTGKWASNPRVIEYAIQLLNWIDDHRDDADVSSIIGRFEYKSEVQPPGRPASVSTDFDKITPLQMDIMKKQLNAAGFDNPTDEQYVEVWKNAKMLGEPIGGDRKKAARQRRKKTREVVNNAELKKLDDGSRKFINKKPVERDRDDGFIPITDKEEAIRALKESND
jgi:hypothetical protein